MSAKDRLLQERKSWRKDHPFSFVAKPSDLPDGSSDMMLWKCKVPGKAGTSWEGGLYPVSLAFSTSYPAKPPTASFPPGFFHPNVYPGGQVCLSILNDDPDMCGAWKASISIKEVLLGLQELLHNPNVNSPAQVRSREIICASLWATRP
ncbi:MAG: hypothetical protein WDW38_001883 [Sanguina aurantia]